MLEARVAECLRVFPAVGILGPRQCGKSTLARAILGQTPASTYLDLERPSDLRKLQEPELFFEQHRGDLVCLDEIQRKPAIDETL
jgi:predicted AAA+ superfamily ATPase